MKWLAMFISALLLMSPVSASAQSEGLMPVMVTAGDLLIENPWTRATPPGAPSAGAYLRVTNHGGTPERLIGGSTDAAGQVQFHEMRVTDGVMMMSAMPEGLAIAPGETVILAPGGFHIMLIGLVAPVAEGSAVTITLEFERAGPVTLEFPAAAIGGASPYSDGMGGGHDMSAMAH